MCFAPGKNVSILPPLRLLEYDNDCWWNIISRWIFLSYLQMKERKKERKEDRMCECLGKISMQAINWNIPFLFSLLFSLRDVNDKWIFSQHVERRDWWNVKLLLILGADRIKIVEIAQNAYLHIFSHSKWNRFESNTFHIKR